MARRRRRRRPARAIVTKRSAVDEAGVSEASAAHDSQDWVKLAFGHFHLACCPSGGSVPDPPPDERSSIGGPVRPAWA